MKNQKPLLLTHGFQTLAPQVKMESLHLPVMKGTVQGGLPLRTDVLQLLLVDHTKMCHREEQLNQSRGRKVIDWFLCLCFNIISLQKSLTDFFVCVSILFLCKIRFRFVNWFFFVFVLYLSNYSFAKYYVLSNHNNFGQGRGAGQE